MTRLHFSRHHIAFLLVVVGICIVISQATPSNLACPEGQKLYEGRCYGVYRPSSKCKHDFNQTAAEDYCQALDGELVSIHSQAEQDFVKSLIKSSQHALAKKLAAEEKCGGCKAPRKDYFYWIGMELVHSANGSVTGATWTDGTTVNYGNPTCACSDFRPPFVTGHPVGSPGDGSDPNEVCPLGNESKCVQIYGFGKTTLGKWTDKHCSDKHKLEPKVCGCEEEEGQGNSTSVRSHKKHPQVPSDSSDEEEEDVIDECRDQAALNGMICKRCPSGWTPFQGHCYLPIGSGLTGVQYDATCTSFGGAVSSIHSAAENVFVSNLAKAAFPSTVSNLIGLRMVRPNNNLNAPVTSATWTDGTPVDYGNPVVAPWNARGVYPWGTGSVAPFPPQPDNVPAPGTCAFMWQPGNTFQLPSEWEDVPCPGIATGTAVCKI